MLRNLIIGTSLLLHPNVGMTQENNRLTEFTADFVQGKSVLHWTVRAGNQCEDIEIEHSSDSIHFENIGLYAGICGNTNTDESYTYTHDSPIPNRTNYYRLNLGIYGYSSVQKIQDISLNQKGYLLIANPSSTSLTLFFDNTNRAKHTLFLFDSKGKLVNAVMGITEGSVQIQRQAMENGIYFFSIYDNERKRYSGNFVLN